MREIKEQEIAIAKAQATKAAALKADAERRAADAGTKAPAETGTIPGGIGTLIEGIPKVGGLPPLPNGADHGVSFAPASRLGGPKPVDDHGQVPSTPRSRTAVPLPAPDYRKQQFLREAHTTACRRFSTALGPEANNAHRNHLHIDMAERGTGAFCE